MKEKIKSKKIRLLLFFLMTSIYVSAQDYAVTPISDLLNSYSQKYVDFLEEMKNSDKELNEKLFAGSNFLNELKDQFKAKRTLEYITKSVKRAKRMSCKGIKVRGVTQCNVETIKVPNSYMHTKDAWITIEGSNKTNVKILEDSSVSIDISATSTRVNKSLVYVVYRYKADLISGIVEKETKDLFDTILKNNNL